MKLKTLLLVAATAAASLTVTTSLATAQTKVRWKMQSAFGAQLPHIGTSAVRFAKNIERLTNLGMHFPGDVQSPALDPL